MKTVGKQNVAYYSELTVLCFIFKFTCVNTKLIVKVFWKHPESSLGNYLKISVYVQQPILNYLYEIKLQHQCDDSWSRHNIKQY